MVGATYTHNIRHMIINDERFFFFNEKIMGDFEHSTKKMAVLPTDIIWVIIMRKVLKKALGVTDYVLGVYRILDGLIDNAIAYKVTYQILRR